MGDANDDVADGGNFGFTSTLLRLLRFCARQGIDLHILGLSC